MSLYILAQIIGFLGYLFYISAPHFRTQTRIMQIEAMAHFILCVQWYLLSHISVMVMSIILGATSMIGIYIRANETLKPLQLFLYPLGCLAVIAVSQNTIIDVLALAGLCFGIASKTAKALEPCRKYGTLAGGVLSLCGALTLSLPAFIFNICFAAGHFTKWMQMRHFSILRTSP